MGDPPSVQQMFRVAGPTPLEVGRPNRMAAALHALGPAGPRLEEARDPDEDEVDLEARCAGLGRGSALASTSRGRFDAGSLPAVSQSPAMLDGEAAHTGSNARASGFTTSIRPAASRRAGVDLPAPFNPAKTRSCGAIDRG